MNAFELSIIMPAFLASVLVLATHVPLDSVEQAVERVLRGEIAGRVVVDVAPR